MRRARIRRAWRTGAAVLGVAALVVLVGGVGRSGEAGRAVARPLAAGAYQPAATADSCTPGEGRRTLWRDQWRLLAKLRDLVVLRDKQDVERLAALGFDSYPHWQTSLAGVGWTAADMDVIMRPEPGHPAMLMYRPSGTENGPADGFDFPYYLAGWAYLAPYDVEQHPADLLPCVSRANWFVHERGIHIAENGGFEPVPPVEDEYGTAPGADPPAAPPPSYGHPRSWDAHVWLSAKGPVISVRNPGRPIQGIALPHGTFFYPPPR